MLIIPAIDLKGGQCVRLVQGDPAKATVYSSDPVEMAKWWVSLGAQRLHVVDLDGALGTGSNVESVLKIIRNVGVMVQMGGGLRNLEQVWHVVRQGIGRVVIGTAILEDPSWLKEAMEELGLRVMAGLDVKNGEVMVKGWAEGSGIELLDAIRKIEALGFRELIYTDISKDGMLTGPNIESIRKVIKSTQMTVYASGGVSNLEDIKALKKLEGDGLGGVIVGKALYDGRITLPNALAAAK